MTSLKQKTVNGLMWSFIDNFSKQGITFIVGIILARILSPIEFGLIGMISIFIAISTSFIESGFSSALIRKKDCTERDYSTVFYFNLAVGLLFFLLLFLTAPLIGHFFHEPQLNGLVKVLSIILIINAITLIQRTTLTKRVDFKMQTKISFIASLFSGIIGIIMAYSGFGVWSLVARVIGQEAIFSLFLWLYNRWRPLWVFDIESFSTMFLFGYKLLISGLIETIYRNIYYLLIGKYFSAQELGFYTRANQFKDLPSANIDGIISRVSYPVLAQLQGNREMLKSAYKKLIKSSMLISFVLMFGLAAIAEPMVIALIGEKWRTSILYLQMLCFVGVLYPLHSLNLNMLNVQGRSDLFLKLEIIKKALAVPTFIVGVFFGIKIMIAGMVVNSIFSYYLNSFYSGKFIDYPMKEQIADILPSFLLAMITGGLVFIIGLLLPINYLYKLIVQLFSGVIIVFTFSEYLKIDSYLIIKQIVISQFSRVKNDSK